MLCGGGWEEGRGAACRGAWHKPPLSPPSLDALLAHPPSPARCSLTSPGAAGGPCRLPGTRQGPLKLGPGGPAGEHLRGAGGRGRREIGSRGAPSPPRGSPLRSGRAAEARRPPRPRPPLLEPRFGRRGNGPIAAPAGRVPAAGLARALCGPIVTATQSRGKTQKTQPNGTRQIPKDFWGLDSTPKATTAGPGAAGVIIVPGLLEGREAQRGSAASEVFEPRPGGPRSPSPQGVFLRKDARHRVTCSSLAWGTMPHSRGTGQPVSTPPWLAGEGVVCAGAVCGLKALRLRGPAGIGLPQPIERAPPPPPTPGD